MNEALIQALQLVFDPFSFLLLAGGMALGIIFGAIPGLTATMAVALLIPITFYLPPAEGIVMLCGVYVGGIYGGSISACLVNIPGTPSSMVTTLDGYPMGQRGEAGKAIGYVTFASFIGGMLSALILIFFAPILAKVAFKFGPVEYFAVAVFGLSIISSVSGDSFIKGCISGVLGMMVTVVGMDYVTSTPRFTFGTTALLSGLTFIPVMIGLFGMREFLMQIGTGTYKFQVVQKVGRILPSFSEMKKNFALCIRGGLIGTFVGILPGAGGPIASFISYDMERRASKHPEKFGTGIPEGICASESANNGVTGGALIPTLTLGVPGDGVTAVMLGAFMVHNIQPGPNLFSNNTTFVYSVYIGFVIANILMLILGLAGARLFAKVLDIPMAILLPFISLLTIVGSFSIRNTAVDIVIMLALGVLGYVMSELKLPVMPMVLGIVLGPIAESNLRGALLISKGDWSIFVKEPISLFLLIISVVLASWPLISKKILGKTPVQRPVGE
jgi:putative tricarboxylic transport membrane protein